MAKKPDADYQTLSRELDAVLAELQQPDVRVDDAVKLYQKGLELTAALEATLKTAQNTITQLKLQASAGDS